MASLIRQADQFGVNNVFILQNQDGQGYEDSHKTWAGAIATIIVVIAILLAEIPNLYHTINRSDVIVKESVEQDVHGFPLNVTFKQNGGFMMGLKLLGTNTSGYLQILMAVANYTNLISIDTSAKGFDLIPCQPYHWKDFSIEYDALDLKEFLCPNTTDDTIIQGQIQFLTSRVIVVAVVQCTALAINNSNKTICKNQSEIDNYLRTNGTFYLAATFIDTKINPSDSSSNYLTPYIRYQLVTFTHNIHTVNFLDIKGYNVSTDESIIPIKNIHNESGLIFDTPVRTLLVDKNQTGLLTLVLQTSTSNRFFVRTFSQLTDLFSSFGGLVTAAFGALFIMRAYNTADFQVKVGQKFIHRQIPNHSSRQNFSFNFFKWVLYSIEPLCGRKSEERMYYDHLRALVQQKCGFQHTLKRIDKLELGMSESERLTSFKSDQNIHLQNRLE